MKRRLILIGILIVAIILMSKLMPHLSLGNNNFVSSVVQDTSSNLTTK